ncbi:M48 family metalloprotease [Amycolatopsis sp. OK19-0408]|uniref:M48 family metalloprotease n=1 Tax=Amycolatopsis iheyensis TaxID=2945988 RepID=A0A9X2NC05_9PSEU|nr:M48 family metalloprotease [Amycolatopsis iheyensis]MCR6484446.1 M48 family metalloprotease [Amycolatopsis iheyensis]
MTIASPAPPWLLFWFVTAVGWTAPRQFPFWRDTVLDVLGATPNPATTVPGSDLLRVAGLVDLVPAFVLLAAVVTVAGAGVRGRLVERRYRLDGFPTPTLAAITGYAKAQLPTVEVRANLRRTDLLAFAYLRRPRRPRLAVFAPLVVLWRRDRAAAEAVVRHELAHCRQGDTLLSGATSPLAFVVRHWPGLFVWTAVVPVGAVWFAAVLDGAGYAGGEVGSGLGLMLLTALGSLLAAVTLPVAGSWSAEFAADHVAGAAAATRLGVPKTRRVTARLTHPPMALRRRLLDAGPRATALAAIACYPVGWLVQLGWLLLAANAAWLQLGESGTQRALGLWVAAGWPVWTAAAVFGAAWPVLRRPWARLVGG